jgi:hypothetical protein
MALVTGTPLGTINAQDDLYLDTAPSLWFQDNDADPLNNPDGDGFYWGITGTTTYPAYALECYEGVSLVSSYEGTNIRCDTVGDKGQIQKLSYLDLTFTLKTMLPLDTLTHILRGGTVTTNAGATEKMGIGQPNNQQYWRVYGAVVYDETAGDYINFTAHRCQFVDAWTLTFAYGAPSTLSVTIRAFADSSKPRSQLFMTLVRADPSAV